MSIPVRTLEPADFLRRVPRQARSAERLETLVDATAELLIDEGYPGVTAAALSARTGMPHSTVYDVVSDPRDLVAVYVLRVMGESYEALVEFAATVEDAEAAVEFVQVITHAFFETYRSDAILRAALSGMDADPAYRWINLADSERNARVIADVISRFTETSDEEVMAQCLLMAHLTGPAVALALDLGGERGDAIIHAFHHVIDRLLAT